jgi:hypothetical protein
MNRKNKNISIRNWKQRNPDKVREWNRRYRFSLYGITEEAYERMLEEQDHCCAICGLHESEMPKGLFIDHDHSCCAGNAKSCGKCVRGLLCRDCNTAVAYLKDNVENLKKAIQYLRKGKRVEKSE